MSDASLFLQAAVTSAALGGLVLLVLARPMRNPRPALLGIAWTLAIALGFLAGCLDLKVKPAWAPADDGTRILGLPLPAEDRDRFLVILLPAVVVAELLAAFQKVPRWFVWVIRLLLSAVAARILLHDSIYLENRGQGPPEWTPSQAWLYLGIMGLVLFIHWTLLELLVREAPGRSVLASLLVVVAGTGLTVMHSGSLSGGQLGIPMAGALAGAFLASWALPPPRVGTGFVGIGLVAVFGLLIAGRFFASLTDRHAIVLIVATLACWVPEFPFLRKLRPWLRGILRVAIVAIPVSLVVLQARQKFQEDSQSSSQPGEPTSEDYDQFGK